MPSDPTMETILELLDQIRERREITPELTEVANLTLHRLHQPIVLWTGITAPEICTAIDHAILRSVLGVEIREVQRVAKDPRRLS